MKFNLPIFALATFFSWATTVQADSAKLEQHHSTQHLVVEGEFGGLAHVLYNVLSYLDGDPAFDSLSSYAEGAGFTTETWAHDPEDMHGLSFKMDLAVGEGSEVSLEENGKIEIKGKAALHLLRAMWLMAMNYPENFHVKHTQAQGEIKLTDLYANSLICEKFLQNTAGTHLEHMVARCLLSP